MKVVLFCGGLGTRLREHSDTVPKSLVNVGIRPIIWHLMRYYAHYGHKDFILCLGYKSWVIKRWFLDYQMAHADFTIRMGSPEKVEIHGDFCVENHGVQLLVDPMSAQYLMGAEIDYKEDLQGAQFVIRNPNAKTTCGCGSSFSA